MEKKEYSVLTTLIIAVFAFGVVFIALDRVERKSAEPPPIIVQSPPSQYPDWDAVKGRNPDPKILAVRLTSKCQPEGCMNNNPATVEFDGVHKKYEVKGKFSRAYLYTEALVDYKRPLTVWDDFYFKIDRMGGHLMGDSNLLPVPPSDISRSLYDLRSISYFPSIRDKEWNINKQININFFSLLQDGVVLDMTASISSDRPGRVMKEVAIYYECFEGSECSMQEK